MLFAAVDAGSNTLRLLVAEVTGGRVRPLRYEREITRLAGGMKDTGLLTAEAMEKSAEALKEFAGIIRDSGAERTRCVGTSALREAANAGEFLVRAEQASGMEVEIISGEREGELTAMGVLSAVENPSSFVIVDIGGGSTELIYSREGEAPGHMSVPAGVVKMVDACMRSDPPSQDELRAIRAEADHVSAGLKAEVERSLAENTALIATAGTASTLAAIDLGLEEFDPRKVHNHRMGLERLRDMSSMLGSLTAQERAALRGLEPERADLIIPGIILTISLMEAMGFSEVLISNSGLLEGIVLELAGRF